MIGEIKPLLEMHYQEIASFKESIPFDPDYERYRQIEEAGNLVIVTARKDGNLLGYSIFFLLTHPHYKSTWMAMNDIVFLHPSERRGTMGMRLIKESERVIRERGITKITWHIKVAHNLAPIFQRLGYVHDESMMSKVLGG